MQRENGIQCIITKYQAGSRYLVWQILQCSFRDVPMHFLGVKWISGYCICGLAIRDMAGDLGTQQRQIIAEQKVKFKRRTDRRAQEGAAT